MYEPLMQELSEFIQPHKSDISVKRSPGQKKTDRLFDSTAHHANILLAASMQGTLTPSAFPWFSVGIKGYNYGQDRDIQVWLDDTSIRVFTALQQSNFSSEGHELYLDLPCFGTGALFEEENTPVAGAGYNGVRFRAMAPGSYSIAEDAQGRIDTLFYEFELSARAAVEKFGEGNVGQRILAAATGPAPETKFEFFHAVYPRGYSTPTRTAGPKNRPWASCWVNPTDMKLMSEGGYQENPFMVPRWTKTSREVFGTGPGHVALPDIKTLNRLKELNLRALAKTVDPPVMTRDDGVIGNVRLTPGGQTHVRDMEAVKTMILEGRFDVTMLNVNDLRASIRDIFFTNQLQLQEGPQMTAYEVQVRYELMQRILGPTLGRIESEFLEPIIERTFWILYRRRQLLPMPAKLQQFMAQGGRLDIEYEGPLARSQRLAESVSLQRFYQIAIPLFELDPAVKDNVDFDDTIRRHGKSVGIPASIMRDPVAVRRIREQRQAEMERQKEMQDAQAAVQTLGKGAPALAAITKAAEAGIIPAAGAVSSATLPARGGNV